MLPNVEPRVVTFIRNGSVMRIVNFVVVCHISVGLLHLSRLFILQVHVYVGKDELFSLLLAFIYFIVVETSIIGFRL